MICHHKLLDCKEWLKVEEKLINKALYLFVSTFSIQVKNKKQQYIIHMIQRDPIFQKINQQVQKNISKKPDFPVYICSKILLIVVNAFIHYPFISKPFSVFSPKSYFFFNEMISFVVPVIQNKIEKNVELAICYYILLASMNYDKEIGFKNFQKAVKLFEEKYLKTDPKNVFPLVNENDEKYMKDFMELSFDKYSSVEFSKNEKISKFYVLFTIIKREMFSNKVNKETIVFSTFCSNKEIFELANKSIKYDSHNHLANLLLAHHYGDSFEFEKCEETLKKVIKLLPEKSVSLPMIYYFLAMRRYININVVNKEEKFTLDEVNQMEKWVNEGKMLEEELKNVFNSAGLGKAINIISNCEALGKHTISVVKKFLKVTRDVQMNFLKLIMCQKCGKKENLKRCQRCKSVVYCSRECQKKDYPKHKLECKEPNLYTVQLNKLVKETRNPNPNDDKNEKNGKK